jgi:hypothetical protein
VSSLGKQFDFDFDDYDDYYSYINEDGGAIPEEIEALIEIEARPH